MDGHAECSNEWDGLPFSFQIKGLRIKERKRRTGIRKDWDFADQNDEGEAKEREHTRVNCQLFVNRRGYAVLSVQVTARPVNENPLPSRHALAFSYSRIKFGRCDESAHWGRSYSLVVET